MPVVCWLGGEEQSESHLEEVHRSSADVLLLRPGATAEGAANWTLLQPTAIQLVTSHMTPPLTPPPAFFFCRWIALTTTATDLTI